MMGALMGTCQTVIEALSDLLEGRVGFLSRMRFRFHLGMCPKCRTYFAQFKHIYAACGRVEPEQLPADFDDVMAQVIRDWKGGR